ncbi:MAG: hypothetical protein ACI9J3_002067 [Parvicellaceae bacterium]|jgi:hypothetical protein
MSYRLLNNVVGWAVFVIAAIVYMMTLEPTTSLWDCGEYITTANQLEVGHPPGAPLFMMLGRVFSAFVDKENAALAVNALSGMCSAFSILFLFWSITMLVKKLAPKFTSLDPGDKFAIVASGAVGALAYAFTDSFWFSAVEGEVYAMSSFFTAVVFWAILKWETKANEPRADRWLVLIFFLMGLSIGVHLLNLLAIPAICFVYYFKKFEFKIWGLIITGVVSIVVLGLIQAVIIPEVVDHAALMEMFTVNVMGLGFNSGAIVFFILLIASISIALYLSQKGELSTFQKVIFFLCVLTLLGFIAGWLLAIPWMIFSFAWIFVKSEKFTKGVLKVTNATVSFILVLLIGYSSFAMIVVRSNANPPLDENNPETLTSLSSYLKREQYGSWPIAHGQYWNTPVVDSKHKNPTYMKAYVLKESTGLVKRPLKRKDGSALAFDNYRSAAKYKDSLAPNAEIVSEYIISDDGKYAEQVFSEKYSTYFPRMYRSGSGQNYMAWCGYEGDKKMPLPAPPEYGGQFRNMEKLRSAVQDNINQAFRANDLEAAANMQKQLASIMKEGIYKPTSGENFQYMMQYQFGWMYFRYFLWNFSGRQNDLQGYNGIGGGEGPFLEGNWLSGVDFVDNVRLGPQENVPHKVSDNKGNNMYYFLPLLLALIGLIYHLVYRPKDWFVVMLLFFFTGLAICIYLNQKPAEPRERDYAFAASFYAFSIWIGIGVWALYDISRRIKWKNLAIIALVTVLFASLTLVINLAFGLSMWYMTLITIPVLGLMMALKKAPGIARAAVAFVLAAPIPIILASENWDDHDRSERYSARDVAKSYLDSCDDNAILFTHGDNDTFPLWYVQEVEKYRTDVRVVNLSLLGTDWHVKQSMRKAYESEPVPFTAEEYQYRQGTRDVIYFYDQEKQAKNEYVSAIEVFDDIMKPASLKVLPNVKKPQYVYHQRKVSIPVNKANAIASGIADTTMVKLPLEDKLEWSISGTMIKSDLMVLDLLAHYDWKRPIYFAGNAAAHGDLSKYFQMEGLTYKLTPFKIAGQHPAGTDSYTFHEDKTYNRLMGTAGDKSFSWGNMDRKNVYVDYYTMRMVYNLRGQFMRFSDELIRNADSSLDPKKAATQRKKAENILDRCFEVMPLDNVNPDDLCYYMLGNYYDLVHADPENEELAAKAQGLADYLIGNRLEDLDYFKKLDDVWTINQLSEIGKALLHMEVTRQASLTQQQTRDQVVNNEVNYGVLADDKYQYALLLDEMKAHFRELADISPKSMRKLSKSEKEAKKSIEASLRSTMTNQRKFPRIVAEDWFPEWF